MNNINLILSNIPISNNSNLCQLCFSDIKCDKLNCTNCQSSTCILCCNNLASRSFAIYNTSNIDNISLVFDCYNCTNKMFVPLDNFDKEELVFINIRDYVNHYHTQVKIESLEQLLENERYLKNQMLETVINCKDTVKKFKSLLKINKDLKYSNEQFIKTIMKQDNDIEEQLNNDISINQLKKQLLKLKIQ